MKLNSKSSNDSGLTCAPVCFRSASLPEGRPVPGWTHPTMQGMETEFQFLLCEKCQRKAKNPKLLACLHTICAECLDENKPIGHCPVCGMSLQHASGVFFQDNVLFSNLQEKLDTYEKITNDVELACDHCKEGAEFWCSECDVFLCRKCYDSHQWFFKRKSHEAQALANLKNNSAREFLDGARKSSTLYCSNPTHNNEGQVTSIYCRGCQKPMCCSCALLDNEHTKLYCDIHVEIDNRKKELGKMSEELVERRKECEKTYSTIHDRVQKMEEVRNETRELIHQRVDEMVQLIRQKGEELLGEVDQQLHQDRQDFEEKLKRAKLMVKRMASSEQLVKKMNLFASDQEVMDMHPFIKESLEELKKLTLPAIGVQVQMENFAGVQEKLQALCRRVRGSRDAAVSVDAAVASVAGTAAPVVNSDVHQDETNQPWVQGKQIQRPTRNLSIGRISRGFVSSMISPVKRQSSQAAKSVQVSAKIMKFEDQDCDAGEPSSSHLQDAATDSQSEPHESTPESERRGTVNPVEVLENSPVEICESENASIVISSSEDTDDDTMCPICGRASVMNT
ncbi:protein PML-like isoform X2 [Tiliqua scincoides]|uniref:protein PML-like isoform X2 n=1 Tax=Tiliqua scincoides TaxID=71010 RepID=UPI003463444C